MSDRELLELAAKAAGYGVDFLIVTTDGVVDRYGYQKWNPRTDDGDCARLETKCEMLVSVDKDCVRSGAYINGYGVECREQYANHDGDRNKARRLASVRCAAEIGKAMP